MTHSLVKYQAFAGAVDGFVAALARLETPLDAAWFLECCREQEDGVHRHRSEGTASGAETQAEIEALVGRMTAAATPEAVRERPVDSDPSPGPLSPARSEPILRLLRSKRLRERAVDIVWASDLHDPEASYWRDLLWYLRVER